MGMVEIGVVLWLCYLKYNLMNLYWVDCDCFVLLNGYGLMLLYLLLYLIGYDLLIEELKNFCQLYLKMLGYLEYGIMLGVEMIIGLFGQGFVNVVGMVFGEVLMVDEFNCDGVKIVDYYMYVFFGDGCLMEGILYEVCLFVGMLKLNKLIVLYDDNGILIDGDVVNWFYDDMLKCFEVYGWNVILNVNGYDVDVVDVVIVKVKLLDKLMLICCKMVIGKGVVIKVGGYDVYGVVFGVEEIVKMCEVFGWKWELFVILQEVYVVWDVKEVGKCVEFEWDVMFVVYCVKFLVEVVEFECWMVNKLLVDWVEKVVVIIVGVNECVEMVVICKVLQQVIEGLVVVLFELFGGLVDLIGLNLINWKVLKVVCVNLEGVGVLFGNYINYGVCEFGMSVVINGFVLYGGYKLFGGMFLMFFDYSCNVLCVVVLMKVLLIFVFMYDLIGFGEDGLMYQLIEYVLSLCLILNYDVWCLVDMVEMVVVWIYVVVVDCLLSLIFSCQNFVFNLCIDVQIVNIEKGGYVLKDWDEEIVVCKIILIVMGLEVEFVMKVVELFVQQGIVVCVVLMLLINVFDCQDVEYCECVLLYGVCCVVIEVGVMSFWYKYVGFEGGVVGIDMFGELVLVGVLFKYFGFIVEYVVEIVKVVLV